MKAKAKNDQKRMSQASFSAIWSLSSMAFWLSLWALLEFRDFRPYAFNVPAFVFGISIITFLTAWLHHEIGTRFLRRAMDGWLRASLMGAVFSILAFAMTPPNGSVFVSALALLLPPALAQTVWLWGRVKQAWLWPLAALLAIPLFVLPFQSYEALWDAALLPFVVLLMGLVQGLVQSVVMLHLWTQERDTAPLKRDTDAASEHAALDRLSLREEPNSTVQDIRNASAKAVGKG